MVIRGILNPPHGTDVYYSAVAHCCWGLHAPSSTQAHKKQVCLLNTLSRGIMRQSRSWCCSRKPMKYKRPASPESREQETIPCSLSAWSAVRRPPRSKSHPPQAVPFKRAPFCLRICLTLLVQVIVVVARRRGYAVRKLHGLDSVVSGCVMCVSS